MENIFEYMKSIFAAVMSFFVMLSGMLGINTGKPESDIPETASGTITAEALGIEDDAEPETAVLEHELLKASPSSITESGTFSVGVADMDLPSPYSETDSAVYKAVGYTYEKVDPIRLRAGILPTAASQSLETLYNDGYIQRTVKKENNKNVNYYKRLPLNLYVNDSAVSGNCIFTCGEGTYFYDYSYICSFISKHSADGSLLKCVQMSNSSAEIHFSGIAPSSSGEVAVCGYSDYNSADGTPYAFIRFYSPELEELRTVKIYGEGNDYFSCIAATSDGGFVAGGKTTSTTHDFDGIPDFGYSASVIMKFDSEGKRKWTRYLGGSGVSEVVDIDADSSGGIFVDISALPSDGDFAAFSGLIKGSLDNVIIKYDSSGLMKWNYVLSSNGRDYFDNVCADGSGGCLAGGSFSLKNGSYTVTSGTLKGVNLSGGSDIYVVSVNSLGLKSWDRLLRGISNDYLCSISKTRNGYVLTGYSESDNGEYTQNAGGYDAFADFITASGEQNVIFHSGEAERDVASSAVSSGNKVYVFGSCGALLENGSAYSDYRAGVYEINQ